MAKLFGEGQGKGLMDGVFLKEVEIIDIITKEDYNKQKEWDAPLYPKTMDFVIKYKDGDFEKDLFLKGDLYKNGSIPQHISSFLVAIGILDDENKDEIIASLSSGDVPTTLLDLAVGKRIKVLEYVKSNGYYDAWNGAQEGFRNNINPFSLETSAEDILRAFKKKLDSNYPPKYDPEGLNAKDKVVKDALEEDSLI